MGSIKSLMKDTAIYGLSSIIGRFLNWCLVPLYTIKFTPAEYGVNTYVYSVVALALIVLTYGMETGFFRFANHDRWKDPMEVYSTSLISLAVSSTAVVVLVALFLDPVTTWMECDGHPEYVMMMAVCVAADAFTAIPFSYLRYRKRPVRFAVLRLVNIGVNIVLNLFFILLCPWLMRVAPPLLVLGVAGIMNQTIDKILYPSLVADKAQAMDGLGIYGANYKIAIVMVMFIQAFRFAYEPFIFAQSRDKGEERLQAYRDAMKYFVIFALVIFLGVMFYIDILKYFISPKYFSGLQVVPIVMLAELFFGIFFNLSLWYKLTDKTVWGMYFSLLGLGITILGNVILVPRMGYMGCAWAALACYTVMMVASYFVGRAKYPIGYPLRRIAAYFVLAAVLYAVGMYVIDMPQVWLRLPLRTLLIAAFVIVVIRHEGIRLPKRLHLSR